MIVLVLKRKVLKAAEIKMHCVENLKHCSFETTTGSDFSIETPMKTASMKITPCPHETL